MSQYFDRLGRELSEDEARDKRGIIRDGVAVRVRMRDSARARRRVTDGGSKPFGLHQPGFRVLDDSLETTLDRVALADVYRQHEEYITNAWRNPVPGFGATAPVVRKPITDTYIVDRVCPDCDGTGEIDGDECERCGGEGELDDGDEKQTRPFGVDHRMTIDQMQVNHARNMDRIYQDHETYLRNAWRGNK